MSPSLPPFPSTVGVENVETRGGGSGVGERRRFRDIPSDVTSPGTPQSHPLQRPFRKPSVVRGGERDLVCKDRRCRKYNGLS